MEKMKISVCMATYNGAKYLREQIDSILKQDLSKYPDAELEVIVSDDMSTDNTIELLRSFNEDRIRIINHCPKRCHKYKKGLFAATENFANALSFATGDFVFLSDQDDIWYPLKISRSLDVLLQEGGVCSASFHVGNNSLKPSGKVICKERSRFALNYFYCGFSLGFTRQFMNLFILPIPIIPAHDMFITLLASFTNSITIIKEPCAFHRWTGEHNVSSHDTQAPFFYRNYYRVKMVLIAFYRSFIVRFISIKGLYKA